MQTSGSSRPPVDYTHLIFFGVAISFFRRDIIMKLIWKKYAVAVTAAVCLLVPVADTGAIAADSGFGGSAWGSNGTDWSNIQAVVVKTDDNIKYLWETPDPDGEELDNEHISGQKGAFVYNIDKKGGENEEFSFCNTAQDGFSASWSGLDSLSIEKGILFKMPMFRASFDNLTVDLKAVTDGFDGDQFNIGVKCDTAKSVSALYIVDHFGAFVFSNDMRYVGEYTVDGKNYVIYKKLIYTEKDGVKAQGYSEYWSMYLRDPGDFETEPDIRMSIDVREHLSNIESFIRVPELLSCGFYANNCGAEGSMDVKYIQINRDYGCWHLSGNVWGTDPVPPEEKEYVLYPDEDGLYFFNDGHAMPGSDYIDFGGTSKTFVRDFGNGDSCSMYVECDDELFIGEKADRFSAVVGDVGAPYARGLGYTFSNGHGFDFGPLYSAEEDYYESDMSYDISLDIYNDSDEETEFSLEMTLPWAGFDSRGVDDDYEGNIIARQTVKPREWVTLSNPHYDMPRALNGGLYLFTDKETGFYVDNVRVAETEDAPKGKGDINGDGVVDALDLVRYRSALLSTESRLMFPRRADIDEDGMVLINDMVLLKKYLLGQESNFSGSIKEHNDRREYSENEGYFCSCFVKDSIGEISYSTGSSGCFDCDIKGAEYATFEYGVSMDGVTAEELDSLYLVYDAEMTAGGDALFGVHGSFEDSQDEFYIIEAGNPNKTVLRGAFNIKQFYYDDYRYDCYLLRKKKDTPDGSVYYNEYWSVMYDYNWYPDVDQIVRGNIDILRQLRELEEEEKLTDMKLDRLDILVGGSDASFSVKRNELFKEYK